MGGVAGRACFVVIGHHMLRPRKMCSIPVRLPSTTHEAGERAMHDPPVFGGRGTQGVLRGIEPKIRSDRCKQEIGASALPASGQARSA